MRRDRGGAVARLAAGAYLLAALAATGCAAPFECASEVDAREAELDGETFADSLITSLRAVAPKGAGFAFSDTRGDLLGRGGCGWSRDERRDRQAFTSRTHNNWGSVSKMITAAAAIHATDHTAGASLDDPFAAYLPARWRALLDPGYAEVTIRMLLQHKAGFDRDGEIYALDAEGEVVDLLAGRLSRPPERPIGVRSYSNLSPIILHFVVAFMTDPDRMRAAEEAIAAMDPGDEFSRDINLAAAQVFVDYAQEHVLAPAGAVGSCNITDFVGHAYSYPDGQSRRGVYPRQEFGGDHTDECSAGGWILNPEGMLAVLTTLRHRGSILSPDSYAQMENAADVDDRLGYADAPVTSDGRAFCHGGSYHDIQAAVCSFPSGVQAVVNVNSSVEGGSDALIAALVDAYEDSRR